METKEGIPSISEEEPLTGRQLYRAELFTKFCQYFGENPSAEEAQLAIRLIDDYRIRTGEIPPADSVIETPTGI